MSRGDRLMAAPDDAHTAEKTLDGFDTVDGAPEPADEELKARRPKPARKPRTKKNRKTA